jgi:transposase-like protein
MKGAMVKIDALLRANQECCTHPHKFVVYDPGYAGGGFSNYECPDCGKT